MRNDRMIPNSEPPKMTPKKRMQLWSRTYLADHLRDNGFVSYNGDDLSWYRLVNGELIQAVYLYSLFRALPLFASISYGMFPTYVEAPFPHSPAGAAWPEGPESSLLRHFRPLKSCPVDYQILAPGTPSWGCDLLDELVFPTFEKTQSCYDAYLYAKEVYAPPRVWPRALIDMVIYYGDEELYPLSFKRFSHYAKDFPYRDVGLAALQGDEEKRKEYLEFLEIRRKKFEKKLEKKFGFEFRTGDRQDR